MGTPVAGGAPAGSACDSARFAACAHARVRSGGGAIGPMDGVSRPSRDPTLHPSVEGMIDGKAIVEAAARLRGSGEPWLLATVVRVSGSSYRRPGARMLAAAGARVAGSVSGGCLEADLVRSGWWRTERGPAVVRFDSSDPDEPGLGCGG